MAIEGPGIICQIKEELTSLLKKKGYKSVSEAVGKGILKQQARKIIFEGAGDLGDSF